MIVGLEGIERTLPRLKTSMSSMLALLWRVAERNGNASQRRTLEFMARALMTEGKKTELTEEELWKKVRTP